MGNRLSKIYTRTGDKGKTGLSDGSRVSKTHPRIEAIGTIDELNSCIGVVNAHSLPSTLNDCLLDIQHDLFDLGGELSLPDSDIIGTAQVERLEQHLDAINSQLPYLKEFILPGGNVAAGMCHLARGICRRAERSVWTLNETEPVNPNTLAYLNRLSDLLFVFARHIARSNGGQEIYWQKFRNKPDTD